MAQARVWDVWDVVRVGAGLPFSTELHRVLPSWYPYFHWLLWGVSVARAEWVMRDKFSTLTWGPACIPGDLPGIADLTPVKPFRHLVSC